MFKYMKNDKFHDVCISSTEKTPHFENFGPQNHFLQTGCGCKVTFICVAPGSKRAEGRLHLGKKKCFSEIFGDSEAEWGITCLDNSESKDVLT